MNNSKALIVIAASGTAVLLVAIFWVLALNYTPFAYSYPDHGQLAVSPHKWTTRPKHVTIRLSIQQTTNRGPHGDWLGYQLQPPASLQPNPPNAVSSGLSSSAASRLAKYQYGATVLTIPAHALVTVIIHNYDSQTALRNPFFTQVQGTVGGVASCAATRDAALTKPDTSFCSGKPFKVMPLDMTSHTFTIPDLGVTVPIGGIGGSNGYISMKFTFRAPNKGTFRWQCIVPCGGGTYGFGDPMSQFGYMNGLFHVV